MRGNASIAVFGREAAAEKREESDKQLAQAKLEIEMEIRRTGTVEDGRVTAKDVLNRAGLKPHFLDKKARWNTRDSLRIWIKERNDEIGSKARRATPGSEEGRALLALREDFVRLQNAYVQETLKAVARRRKLKQTLVRAASLERENHSLKERLRSAGPSESRRGSAPAE